MGILVLLAVFTEYAADTSGRSFALVYAAFLVVQTVLWFTVWRQDRRDHPEYQAATGAMWSAWPSRWWRILADKPPSRPPHAFVVWGLLCRRLIVGIVLAASGSRVGLGLTPTDSLVERFGLFTIIVLGEVVLGVVAGLSAAERDAKTVITGLLALWLGFGFWWIYFDLVGRLPPRTDGGALSSWVMSHLPITGSITAAGAGMVSLIAHAHDPRTPAGDELAAGRCRGRGLLALVLTERALVDAERLSSVFGPLGPALAAGAVAALVVGWAPAGALAAGAVAGGDPLRGLVLRRQPLPARRRLGRAVASLQPVAVTVWRVIVAATPSPSPLASSMRSVSDRNTSSVSSGS